MCAALHCNQSEICSQTILSSTSGLCRSGLRSYRMDYLSALLNQKFGKFFGGLDAQTPSYTCTDCCYTCCLTQSNFLRLTQCRRVRGALYAISFHHSRGACNDSIVLWKMTIYDVFFDHSSRPFMSHAFSVPSTLLLLAPPLHLNLKHSLSLQIPNWPGQGKLNQ